MEIRLNEGKKNYFGTMWFAHIAFVAIICQMLQQNSAYGGKRRKKQILKHQTWTKTFFTLVFSPNANDLISVGVLKMLYN